MERSDVNYGIEYFGHLSFPEISFKRRIKRKRNVETK
jgi:hypothetical protein